MNSHWVKGIIAILLSSLLLGAFPLPRTGGDHQQEAQERRSRRTIIVNASGGGDYVTIQAAVNAAQNRDTIIVEAGTYRENVFVDKSIRLVGAGCENTTIIGHGTGGGTYPPPRYGIHITANWVNISGFRVTNEGRGIYLDGIEYCNISENNCSYNYYGIESDNTNHSIISDNVCNNNGLDFVPYLWGSTKEGIGMLISNSNNNSIIRNLCDSNLPGWDYMGDTGGYEEGTGIEASNSDNNIFINNTIHGHNVFFGRGIRLKGVQNILMGNNISDNYYGIEIFDSSNKILKNTFINNTEVAIKISGWDNPRPSNNSILSNNFLNNNNGETQARDYGEHNNWNGSVGEGNFWSDYTHRYPNASNDEFVWDTPYEIQGDAHSKDFFPLFGPPDNLTVYPIALAGSDGYIDQHKSLTFNGSRSFDYFAITNYTWSFRYNNTNTSLFGLTPTFTFHAAGKYTVTLTVTNTKGCKDSDQMRVYVLDVDPPIPDAGPDSVIWQGETFFFNSSGSWDNTGIVNFTWNFTYNNNDVFLYGKSPIFTFNIPGIYKNTLNATDVWENWATDEMILDVKDSTWPAANAGEDITIDQHMVVTFNGNDSFDDVGLVNYTWSFTYRGKEIYLYGETNTYIFDDAGSYIVVLNVSDAEGNWARDSLNVTVIDITPPTANGGENITIIQGQTVSFDANQSTDNVGIVNYSWSFFYNDTNQTLFGVDPKFKFDMQGLYIVELRVQDAVNLHDKDTITIIVHPKDLPDDGNDSVKPHANAGNNVTINTNSTFSFNSTGSWDNTGIVNYTWSLNYGGESITLYGPHPSFKFEKGGNYTVILIVRDKAGNIEEDVITVIVIEEIGNDDPENDDHPENDDNAGVDGEPEEKRSWGSGRMMVLIIVCSIAIIAVLYYFLRREPEKDEAEEKTDEFGRTDAEGEPEISDNEDDMGDVDEDDKNEVDE